MEEEGSTMNTYEWYQRPVTFGLLVPLTVIALIFTLVILTFFFTHWNLMIKKSLHHHAVFLLTIVSLFYMAFDLPFSMNYLRIGHHPYRTVPFCLWWYWFDYSLLTISLCLTATASFQRHILVFQSHWLQFRTRRFLLHYLPLTIALVYPPVFYVALMFIYQCEVNYDPRDGWCAYPCYLDHKVLFNLDWMMNTFLPVIAIVIGNAALILRVIRSMKKIRQQHRTIWQRQKKLTLQLLSFSSLYVIVYLPTMIVALLRLYFFPNLYTDNPHLYDIFHLIYFVCPLQSFFCLFALPELIAFLRRHWQRGSIGSLESSALPAR